MIEFPFQTSFWFDQGQAPAPALKMNTLADVAIVGGGFAGLSSALELKALAPQRKVIVLEAKHLGFGASGRNGGWLIPFPPLYWLADDLNDPQRRADFLFATNFGLQAIQNLRRSFRAKENDSAWFRTRHHLVARNRFELATIRWLKSRLDLVGIPCTHHDSSFAKNLVGYPALGAMSWETEMINPYQLIHFLRARCEQLGVEIFENSAVKKVDWQNPKILRLDCENGSSVQAETVVLATNAYISSLQLGIQMPRTSTQHTYMIATEKLSPQQIQKISRESFPFGDPNLFYFCGRFHDQRLIFNGCDRSSQASLQDDQHLASYQRLHQEMLRRFPHLREVRLESAWGGAVLQTNSEVPILRRSQENPNLILNIGYGGSSGIGAALQSGRLVADLILGEQSQDADAKRLQQILQNTRFPPLGPLRAVFGVVKNMLV